MAQAVVIPTDAADRAEAVLDHRTLVEWLRQMTIALLQKRSFGGEMEVTAPDVVNGYVDVTFATERIDGNYVPSGTVIMADGAESDVRIDFSTIATTGFRANVREIGTLYWRITPYE